MLFEAEKWILSVLPAMVTFDVTSRTVDASGIWFDAYAVVDGAANALLAS